MRRHVREVQDSSHIYPSPRPLSPSHAEFKILSALHSHSFPFPLLDTLFKFYLLLPSKAYGSSRAQWKVSLPTQRVS